MSVIEVAGRACKKYKLVAEIVAKQVILLMKQPDELEVAISFVSEKEIRRLNREIREIDKVTDVLSFPATEIKAGEILDLTKDEMLYLMTDNHKFHLGDMAICLKQTKRQAKEYGTTPLHEVKKLVIHSMLHLMGYDHIKDDDYEIMNKKEIELDKKITL